jgi:hypothetical protein
LGGEDELTVFGGCRVEEFHVYFEFVKEFFAWFFEGVFEFAVDKGGVEGGLGNDVSD